MHSTYPVCAHCPTSLPCQLCDVSFPFDLGMCVALLWSQKNLRSCCYHCSWNELTPRTAPHCWKIEVRFGFRQANASVALSALTQPLFHQCLTRHGCSQLVLLCRQHMGCDLWFDGNIGPILLLWACGLVPGLRIVSRPGFPSCCHCPVTSPLHYHCSCIKSLGLHPRVIHGPFHCTHSTWRTHWRRC